MKKHFLDFETGTVDSGLSEPLEPNFSFNGNSVVESGGTRYGNTALANLNVINGLWARDGTHVLKVYVDGRNRRLDGGRDGDYGFRAELGTALEPHKFHPGDYQFFTASFWLDESWDQVSMISTVITQWKISGENPHAAIRLSNLGDCALLRLDPTTFG